MRTWDRDIDFDFSDNLLDELLYKEKYEINLRYFIQKFNGCKTIAY